jgi:hypothetical protein
LENREIGKKSASRIRDSEEIGKQDTRFKELENLPVEYPA